MKSNFANYAEEEDYLNAQKNKIREQIEKSSSRIKQLRANLCELTYECSEIKGFKEKPVELITEQNDTFKKDYKFILAETCAEIFKPFKKKNYRSTGKVNVKFSNNLVAFAIDHTWTFNDLAKRSSKFWGFPADSIHFSISPQADSPVFLKGTNIFHELYSFGSIRTFIVPTVHIVLRNHNNEEPSKIESPKVIKETNYEFDSDEPTDRIYFTGKVKQRAKKNIYIRVLQTVILVGFFVMWNLSLVLEKNIHESSWTSTNIQEHFFDDPFPRPLHDIYSQSDYTSFLEIHNQWDFWSKIRSISASIFYNNIDAGYDGALSSYYFIYEAIELRQLRSNKQLCEIEEYGQAICMRKVSLDKSTDTYSTGDSGFVYDSSGKFTWFTGIVDSYTLDGFKRPLNTNILPAWEIHLSNLIADNWIDEQTRALFVTMNIVNPNTGLFTVLAITVEIGPHGNYVPNYFIKSVYYDTSSLGFTTMHSGVLFWLLLLMFFELRKYFMTENETKFLEEGKLKQYQKEGLSDVMIERKLKKKFKKWTKNDKIKWYKRFRRPKLNGMVVLAGLLIVLLTQIFYIIWNHSTLATTVVKEGDYTDLLEITAVYDSIYSVKLMCTVVLGTLLCKYTLNWFSFLIEFYLIIKKSLFDLMYLFVIYFCLQLTFCTAIYFSIGAYEYAYSNYSNSFFNTVALNLGGFFLGRNTESLVSLSNLAIMLILTKIVMSIFHMIFMATIYTRLSKARKLVNK